MALKRRLEERENPDSKRKKLTHLVLNPLGALPNVNCYGPPTIGANRASHRSDFSTQNADTLIIERDYTAEISRDTDENVTGGQICAESSTEEEEEAVQKQIEAEEAARKKAAEEEARKKAAEEEAKRRAAQEEAKRKAAEAEAERKRKDNHLVNSTEKTETTSTRERSRKPRYKHEKHGVKNTVGAWSNEEWDQYVTDDVILVHSKKKTKVNVYESGRTEHQLMREWEDDESTTEWNEDRQYKINYKFHKASTDPCSIM